MATVLPLAQDAERRLRDLVAGKKPAGMGGGLAARGAGAKASAVPTKAPASGRQVVFPAKLAMGDDTRILQVGPALQPPLLEAFCVAGGGSRAEAPPRRAPPPSPARRTACACAFAAAAGAGRDTPGPDGATPCCALPLN